MRTTGIFTTHRYEVRVNKRDPLYLIFFGDVHRDAPLCAVEAWQGFLDYAREKAKKENCLFIGMGDYVDGVSSSERMKVATAGFHESTLEVWEDGWQREVDRLAKELAFTKGKLCCLLEGNHYAQFRDGTTSTMRLARALKTQYVGVSCFTRLMLRRGTSCYSLDMWLHHGAGAARMTGGSINRVEQMLEGAICDVAAMGHDHRRMAVPATPKLYLAPAQAGQSRSGLVLRQKQPWLLRTGSFLRGYVDGKASYISDWAKNPCSLGHVELEVRLKEMGRDNVSVEIRGIA